MIFIYIGLLLWVVWLLYLYARPLPEPGLVKHNVAHVDGWEIHYQILGQGSPVVLLQGAATSLYSWRKLAPRLAEQNTVLAIDLPGFGLSEKKPEDDYRIEAQAQRVIGFLDQMQMARVTLVGSSLGGLIALQITRLKPELVEQLVLISPPFQPMGWLRIFAFPLPIWFWYLLSLLVHSRIVAWLMRTIVLADTKNVSQDVYAYAQPYVKNPLALRALAQSLAAIPTALQQLHQSMISAPTLLLWGARDRVIELAAMHLLRQRLQQCHFIVHEQGGHHLHEDSPDWTHAQIQLFFRREIDSTRLE